MHTYRDPCTYYAYMRVYAYVQIIGCRYTFIYAHITEYNTNERAIMNQNAMYLQTGDSSMNIYMHIVHT